MREVPLPSLCQLVDTKDVAVSGVLLLAGCAVLVVLTFSARAVLRTTGQQAATGSDPTAKSLARWRWTGIGLGVVLAAGTVAAGDLGRGPLLASVVFGLGALAGILTGELLVRPDRGTQRHASVQPRSVKVYRPRILGRVVAAATAILIVLMIATTAGGSADDQQRAGRSLTYSPNSTLGASSGPWPGSYYTTAAAVALLVAGIATAVVLVTVARRPAIADRGADHAQRRRSAETVTAAWGMAVGVPLVGFSLTAASALIGIAVAPLWWRVAGWSLLALAASGLVLVLWCLAALLLPSRLTVPAPTPA